MRATLLLLLATITAASAPPPKDTARRYATTLDHLERFCSQTDCFSDEKFWRESARVARQTAPDIIHAIMLRSPKWRAEEGLLYVPLVAFLPRGDTMKLLRDYLRSTNEFERIWAREFITELDMPDTQKAIRALSGSHQ